MNIYIESFFIYRHNANTLAKLDDLIMASMELTHRDGNEHKNIIHMYYR